MVRPQIILGISPGTRLMGIAILRREKLSLLQIKTFKEHWSSSKLKDILYSIKEIIDKYEISCLCIRKLNPRHSSSGLQELVGEIEILCKQKKLVYKSYSLPDLKSLFTDNQKFSKRQMIRTLAEQNPFLHELYNREMKLSVPYYEKMFEAIITVLLYRKQHPPRGLIVSPFSSLFL